MKDCTLPASAEVITRVRKFRKERGISAKELARLMTASGYLASRSSIAQAESGYRKEVSVDWVLVASKVLGVDPVAVFRGPQCTACDDAPPRGFSCTRCERVSP